MHSIYYLVSLVTLLVTFETRFEKCCENHVFGISANYTKNIVFRDRLLTISIFLHDQALVKRMS